MKKKYFTLYIDNFDNFYTYITNRNIFEIYWSRKSNYL